MIFLAQFGITKHLQIFQRLQIALALRTRAIFCGLLKNLKVGGAVASWLVRSTPERAVRVRALAGDIVLCS